MPNIIERTITLLAAVITLLSVFTSFLANSNFDLFGAFDFDFAPRLVLSILIDAAIIWCFSKLLFVCLTGSFPHLTMVLILGILVTNVWQTDAVFHSLLFSNDISQNWSLAAYLLLLFFSALMFGSLVYSHAREFGKRFRSPFSVPKKDSLKYNTFLLGRFNLILASILSYAPVGAWRVLSTASS